MKHYFITITTLLLSLVANAETLSLDTCRARALRNNKQLQMAKVSREIATNTRKMARTKYLPHVDIAGGYMLSNQTVSILNTDQKSILGNAGTLIAKELPILSALFPQMEAQINAAGQKVIDAFETNTHQVFVATAMLTQPIYMGGAITAANNMADISEKMAATREEQSIKDILHSTEEAYWLVVSLTQKEQLADSYLQLVKKLNDDVHKMIVEGVATRADGLKVDVAVNEAEMLKTKVTNGLSLSKMHLCQLCGMPMSDSESVTIEIPSDFGTADDLAGLSADRSELSLINDAISISKQQTKLARAGYMPQIALMGGTIFTNPNVYNGFERKFRGSLNVGVMVRIPVLDWGETAYKIRAAKNATTLTELTYSETEELINLQVSQCRYKFSEATKRLVTAQKNITSADENLRCATLGFKEGIMSTTDVMSAQTAWMKAKTEVIDSEIDVKVSQTELYKALGR